jgi:hypothetical protein
MAATLIETSVLEAILLFIGGHFVQFNICCYNICHSLANTNLTNYKPINFARSQAGFHYASLFTYFFDPVK